MDNDANSSMILRERRVQYFSATEEKYAKSGCRKLLDLKRFAFGLDLSQVILQLLKQPTFCGSIEGNREPNGHLCADSRMSIQYTRECLAADTESARCPGNRLTNRIKTTLTQ